MIAAAQHNQPGSPGVSGLAGPGFRADIQGLRALAVLLVLVYHLWPGVLPGGYVGVDVFFVISGYLITGLLLREHERSGRISMWRFYARRLRRLLPAATATLVAVVVASVILLPEPYWRDIALEVLASALYVENWWLALQSVDYLAEGAVASPLQHYWSLSVEEQFYIVWPWVIAGAALLASRRNAGIRVAVGAAVAVVVLASLSHSVWLTREEAGVAYFATTTRVWELGLGAALAVLPWRPTANVAKLLGWGGLTMVVAAAFVLDAETPFPGSIALLPTVGTAMAIAAGGARSGADASRLLESAPARFLGDISYSLYLWHWPVIVFHSHLTGGPPSLVGGVLLAALSIALAALSRRLIEEPALRVGRAEGLGAAPYALGAACIGISIALAFGQYVAADRGAPEPQVAVETGDAAPGAAVMQPGYRHSFTPALNRAKHDRPDVGMKCHGGLRDSEPNPGCVIGAEEARYDLVLVGDSHAWHWVPALVELVAPLDMRLHLMTKSACPFTLATLSRNGKPYKECEDWNRAVVRYVESVQPDLVLSGASANVAALRQPGQSSARMVAEGFLPLWNEVLASGARILVIRDTPRFAGPTDDPVRCLAREEGRIGECVVSRDRALKAPDEDPALVAMRSAPAGTHLVDMTDSICNPHACDPVVGGVLVLRDSHHLTATYARTLAPVLGRELAPHLRER